MKKTLLTEHLQVIHLKDHTIDLSQIGNRRFMFHPSGILILGDEDRLHPGKELYSSHAEEYHEAAIAQTLPSYDSFCRGWIGNSKTYPYGIIHFAPGIQANYLPHFEAAFSFIETSQKNGFTDKVILRNFCDQWEQSLNHLLHYKENSIDSKIKAAGKGRGNPTYNHSAEIER